MSFHQQIQGISLFKGVSAESMNLLVAQAAYKKYEANQMVIGETDQVRAFLLMITGRKNISRTNHKEKRKTIKIKGREKH